MPLTYLIKKNKDQKMEGILKKLGYALSTRRFAYLWILSFHYCATCKADLNITDFELIPYFESRYSKGKDTQIKIGKDYMGALLNHLFQKKGLAYHLMHFCENQLSSMMCQGTICVHMLR